MDNRNEILWAYIFELYNVSSYEELKRELKKRYSIIL
jgi:hypothetical protein